MRVCKTRDFDKIKAKFLSNRIFLLADQDGGERHKEDRHTKLSNISNGSGHHFSYMTTGAIEIENIVSGTILKKIIPKLIDKAEVTKVDQEKYEKTRIGDYILSVLKKEHHADISTDNGALRSYYKNKFADKVVELVSSGEINWNMIEENRHAQKIIKELYNFICLNNRISNNQEV